MKIETEQYLITSDKYNFILQMKEIIQDSHLLEDKSKVGTVRLGEKSFYPSIGALYRGMVHHVAMRDENMETLCELRKFIHSAADELERKLNAMG